MNDLRLIILIIGLCILALIYFWETGKKRRQQRRQTVNYPSGDSDAQGLKIGPVKDMEADYSAVIADLNEALNKSRQEEDEAVSRIFTRETVDRRGSAKSDDGPQVNPVTGDLFGGAGPRAEKSGRNSSAVGLSDINGSRIISLYITAPSGRSFSTAEIFNAAKETGLEFGDMNIFHHFGIGITKSGRPLFSVADMYEPGCFDPDRGKAGTTRGLSLFMCLPTPVEDERAFELMLNTAHELAGILGGEVLGPDHETLNMEHIQSINRTIKTA